MTIEEYYLTFGFKIKISSLIAHVGYTLDMLTDEIRNEHGNDEYSPGNDGNILLYWFKDEYLDGGFVGHRVFEINGTEFIIRGFTHNKKEHDKYVVVGVNLGTIKNFEGILNTTGAEGKEGLRVLVQDENWARMITECENVNACYCSFIDYGVPSPKYEGFYTEPKVHMTTNDCSCCS